jgi:hypothetical protein
MSWMGSSHLPSRRGFAENVVHIVFIYVLCHCTYIYAFSSFLRGDRRVNSRDFRSSFTMRPTARQLHAVASCLSRQNCISFIGLGRMGSQMAFNLFSKTFVERPDSRFLVCDTIPEVVQGFKQSFLSHFPSARIDIAATPEQYVHYSFSFCQSF